jgi:uncharacterized DUF497 family protein
MALEWDEAKRLWTLRDRRLDFVDAALAFDGRAAVHLAAMTQNEERFLTVALMEGKFYTVVWSWRGDNRRIISMRRSRGGEERHYRALYG